MNVYLSDTTAKTVQTTAEVVKNLIDEGKKCIVFSEDKITLSLELEIASRLGGGFFDVDVTTFKRYLTSKNENARVLSKESSVMIIRKIVSDLSKEFKCFKNALNSPNIALVLYELISQLASAKVTPINLKQLLKNDSDLSPALNSKIKDVIFVYEEYLNRVSEAGYFDSNDYLSLMPEICSSDEAIKNSAVIIAGFSSVTKQRYDVFEALNKVSKEFHAVVSYDQNSELYTGETYFKLLKIDPLAVVKNVCGNLLPEAEFIKRNLFTPVGDNFEPMNTERVSLYQASDLSDEAEWLAKDLLSEVRNKNLRYKDIAVAVGSFVDALPSIARAFEDYGVPYFVEKTTSLSEHPACDFIVNVLDFSRRGLNARDFAKIVSSGLFIPDKKLADKLVNYVYANAITRKSFKTAFSIEDKNLTAFEDIRAVVMDVECRLSKSKTVSDFISAVRFLLSAVNARENLSKLTFDLKNSNYPLLADFNDKVFDKIDALLFEMEGVLGTSKITALEFKNLFLSGAVGTQISSIPILNDAVYIGECKDVKIKSAKVLYAVALNGDVPFTQSDTAILSDGDLSVLDGFDLIVEPKIKSVNLREKENVAVSLCSFTEKLKLSYSTEKFDGSKNFKSDAIKSLTQLFNLKPQTRRISYFAGEKDARLDSLSSGFTSEKTALMEIARTYPLYKLSEADAISKVASFYKATEVLNAPSLKEKADVLLADKKVSKSINEGENLSVSGSEISASVLETYFSCPYKNYASNVLRLSESPVLDVLVNETGTLLHKVNELYSDRLKEVSDKISSDALVCKIFDGLKEDKNFKKYTATPKTQAVLSRLLKESKRVCYNIYSSLENSSFKTVLQEARFGKTADIPAIELNAKSGKVFVKGVVDRVDAYSDYVRIIDYKSGKIDDSEESFYTGKKLQLYLYMNAFIRDGVKPAGVYYYPVKDEYSAEGEDYVMLGKTLSDKEVLTATDRDIETTRSSKVIKVKLKADGNPNSYADVLSSDEMRKFIAYSKLVSKTCVDEIRSGYIAPSPYEKACDYCQYGGMCGFCQSEGDLFRKVEKVDVSTITKAVDLLEIQTDKAENEDE